MIHPSLIPSIDYPTSWYAATRTDNHLRSKLEGLKNADVCIIGAGLAGLSIGLELARLGVSVAIVEAGRIAWGASGRNGGFVLPGFAAEMGKVIQRSGVEKAQRLYGYSVMGAERVRENIETLAPECLMGEGELSVSRYPNYDEMMGYAALLNDTFGASVEMRTTTEMRQVLKSERCFEGVFNPAGFHIHPLNFALALGAEIENLGGVIFEGSAAVSFERVDNRFEIKTKKGLVTAGQMVVCTSGYDQGFYPPLSRSVLPVATHVAVTAELNDALKSLIATEACIADTRNAGDYYRLVQDGAAKRLLWGGKISALTTPPGELDGLMRRAMIEVFPEFAEVEIDYSWSGLMGYCRHKMPVVRQQEEGVWVATAFGGQGLNTTAMAGVLVASAIVEDDQRWRDFDDYGLHWGGGLIGKAAVQPVYWWLQLKDKISELKS